MQGTYWIIRDKAQVDKVLTNVANWAKDEWDFTVPLCLQPKKYANPRSLSQNALLHVWFDTMAKHFSRKVDTNAEQMKALMKLKFLGTENIIVGNTVIEGQLKRTSKLDKGEMMRFMDDVYDWALDHGVRLSIPEDSEYMKLRKQHG